MRLLLVLMLLVPGFAAYALDLPQNRPNPDRAALEQQLQRQSEMPPGRIEGFVHIPDQKERVLVQALGRTFRDVRTRVQPWFDGVLIIIAVLAMVALYCFAGPMRYTPDPAGRTIRRFTWWERLVHWFTAVSFIWLALTGLNLVLGRHLLQPLIGDNAFSTIASLGKLSHNSMGIGFMIGLALMSIQWFIHNIPTKLDWEWIKTAGGMFGGAHPPARKFNAGQKMIYWIAVFGGGAVSLTGIALLLPFAFGNIEVMQAAHLIHSVVAALMIAVVIGHIYLGSVGVQGSFQAMSTGRVDLNWAHHHHGLWADEEEAKRPQLISPPAVRPAE